MSDKPKQTLMAVMLTARPFEYFAVQQHLKDIREERHPQGTVYERGSFAGNNGTWSVAITEISMGNDTAAFECERAINHFKPQVIFMVGIAGGIKDVELGDVVAAEKIYGYESGRAEKVFRTRPDVGQSSYALIQRAKTEARTGRWHSRLNQWGTDRHPRAFVGPIAAGEKVVASTRSSTYVFLRNNYSDSLAVEMEGRGFLHAAHANAEISAIVVRGISDLLDDKEETDKKGYQELAAQSAAAFAFEILANYIPPMSSGTIVAKDEAEQVKKITNNFVSSIRSQCVGKTIVDRPQAQEIVDALIRDRTETTLVLGRSGTGKSALLASVAERMVDLDWTVMAFSLDRPTLADPPGGIGSQLDLTDSTADVLTRCAGGQNALLVLDQLDSASRTSGKHAGALDGVAAMLRDLKPLARARVLIGCRDSDYRSDNRLRDLIQGATEIVEVGLPGFDDETVKSIVQDLGINPDLLSEAQIRLLSVPLHIKLLEMCLAANPATSLDFRTARDLCDKLWEEKQLAIRNRHGQDIRWTNMMDSLTDHMNEFQTLTVPKEVLDEFGRDADILESEGLITRENHHYRFFHESFFDYVFARRFVGRTRNISELIQAEGDEMFRRTQVKYLLSYERSAHRKRYLSDLEGALVASTSRALIRDAIFDFLRELDEPTVEEWQVVNRCIQASEAEPQMTDAQMILNIAHGSVPWFHLLVENGILKRWLHDDSGEMVDVVFRLLAGVQNEVPDSVADILEPLETESDEWKRRIVDFFVFYGLGHNRRLFNLLLRVFKAGGSDQILTGGQDHHVFWTLVWQVGRQNPAWSCELIAAYIGRCHKLSHDQAETNPFSGNPPVIPHEQWANDLILEYASKAPSAFVDHVLPIMRLIIEQNIPESREERHSRDDVWDHRAFGEVTEMSDAILSGMVRALQRLSERSPESIDPVLQSFRGSDYETLHYLLIRAFTANGRYFADTAADYLLESSERFRIGYIENEHWAARELLSAISPYCSEDRVARLEESILQYELPSTARYRDKRMARDYARLTLLQGISEDRMSRKGADRLLSMEKEFADDPPTRPPRRAGGPVISPITLSAAQVMTDEHWLRSMQKYHEDNAKWRTEEGWIGGAYQLSQVLEEQTKKEPERFARLLLTFPIDLNRVYFEAVLRGVAGKAIDTATLVSVLKRCHGLPGHPLGRWICYVLEHTKDADLPVEILAMAAWYAVNDPNPVHADIEHNADSVLMEGFNSVRGSAAISIGNLIEVQGAKLDLLDEPLRLLVRDPSIAVRTCVAFTLCALYRHDQRRAVDLFMDLCDAPDALLATRYVRNFLRMALSECFSELEAILRRMMDSPDRGVGAIAAYEVTGASFRIEQALAMASECAGGSVPLRLGSARLYAHGIRSAAARNRCEKALTVFFSDPDKTVREEAAKCFSNLFGSAAHQYAALIRVFVRSAAFAEFHSDLILFLSQAQGPPPDVILDATEAFLNCAGVAASDISTSTGGDGYRIQELVFRVRTETYEVSVKRECDALISRMLDMNVSGVKENLLKLQDAERRL